MSESKRLELQQLAQDLGEMHSNNYLSEIIAGVGTCPLNLVGSAGQCSRPLSTAVGSAGQGRAVFGQSDLANNWAVFWLFF